MDLDGIGFSAGAAAKTFCERLFAKSAQAAPQSLNSFSPVSLELSSGPGSASYCFGQYAKLGSCVGRLDDKCRSELFYIFSAAADLMRKGGGFDPDALAGSASWRLRRSLELKGVDLASALKGMLLAFQGGEQGGFLG